MKGFQVVYLIWIFIKILGFVECCSVQNPDDVVDNAFLSCQKNDTCEAECYPGYIFPTGKTKANYSCHEDISERTSSCKRIPVVIIKYVVLWIFHNVVPSTCENFPSLLGESDKMIGDISELCNELAVYVNVTFTYSTLSFLMNTTFVGKYYNYTSTTVLETCLTLHLDQLQNHTLPYIDSFLGNVTCGNETVNHTIVINLHVSDRQESCPYGTEVMNVSHTPSGQDAIAKYCDISSTSDSFLNNEFKSFPESTIKVTDSSQEISFQNASTDVIPSDMQKNLDADSLAISIAVPIATIVFLSAIVTAIIFYKIRSRAIERQKLYQTILRVRDGHNIALTNDSHNYDVMDLRKNSNEESSYSNQGLSIL